jgi:rare lipoprotein A (peptidoglycan hydrolase)
LQGVYSLDHLLNKQHSVSGCGSASAGLAFRARAWRLSGWLRTVSYCCLLLLLSDCASASKRPAPKSPSAATQQKKTSRKARKKGETSTVSRKKASQPSPPQPSQTTSQEEAELLARYEGKSARRVYRGKATYYGNSLAGHKTASGEVYNPQRFTAAHRQLPFGTVLRVVRTDTNRYVYVRVTDRGPFAGGGRIIDLSYIAAQRLGMIRAGVAPVRLEVVSE